MSELDREMTTSCGHTWNLRRTACPECFTTLRARVAELEDDLRQAIAGENEARAVAARRGDELDEAMERRVKAEVRVQNLEEALRPFAEEPKCYLRTNLWEPRRKAQLLLGPSPYPEVEP